MRLRDINTKYLYVVLIENSEAITLILAAYWVSNSLATPHVATIHVWKHHIGLALNYLKARK